jgi:hypothetical protein
MPVNAEFEGSWNERGSAVLMLQGAVIAIVMLSPASRGSVHSFDGRLPRRVRMPLRASNFQN